MHDEIMFFFLSAFCRKVRKTAAITGLVGRIEDFEQCSRGRVDTFFMVRCSLFLSMMEMFFFFGR